MFYKTNFHEGRPFESQEKLFLMEEFFDRSDRKIHIGRARRDYLKNQVLFQINLEERRHRLSKLLDYETTQLIDENLNKIQGIESRKNNLLQKAIQIRKQTETERQDIAQGKINLLNRLKDDGFRQIQGRNHQLLINSDVEKIKEITERIRREEKCTKEFWKSKILENTDDLLKKERQIHEKKEIYKKECLEEIALKEKDNELAKDLKKEELKRNIQSNINLNKELDADKQRRYVESLEKQGLYRSILDDHVNRSKKLKNKTINDERSFDTIMFDENVQSLRKVQQSTLLKKLDNMKTLKDFLHYSDCIKSTIKEEDSVLNKAVLKTDKEVHIKRRDIEKQKTKKYQDLISGIKAYQKYHMFDVEKRKSAEKQLELFDREMFNKVYLEDLKEDQMKAEKAKLKIRNHNIDLNSQLQFNEELRKERRIEKERERKSMREAENNYLSIRKDVVSNVKLMNLHPWRDRSLATN